MKDILQWTAKILALALSLCYFYQVLYLFVPFFVRRKSHRQTTLRRYAILIAARNEEAVLPYLLDSIAQQDYPQALLTTFVVADNCTDRTAEAAERCGALVYRRQNRMQVGKGYALSYLLERIRDAGKLDRFDAFLVFDADNLLCPDYISKINETCSDGCEVFCGYRNSKNFGDNWISAGYGLWYLHDSVHLNASRMLLGVNCAVSGTGFGFTRTALEQFGGWHFFTLTEDIEFDTWCATHGLQIGFCPDAMLYDEQPTSFRQSWRQRTRWVQGGIQIAGRYGKDMLCGLGKGGKITYASFETATLSLWGCLFSAAVMILSVTASWLQGRNLVLTIASVVAGGYGSMWLIGLLTMLTEWEKIACSTGKKLQSLFTFPIFMMTYVPVAVCAVFQKFQWKPIAHTVAVPVNQLVPEQRRMASSE